MKHRFEAVQWVPYDVPFVFAFLADPHNLPGLMPAWQKTRIEEAFLVAPPPAPSGSFTGSKKRALSAGAGSRITISFRPFPLSPVRLPWEAEIAEFAWNDYFCDVQQRGPFAEWRHCHRVRAERREGVDGTRITDQVSYAMKMGPLGEWAHGMLVRRQLESMFAYRQKRVAEIFARIAQAGAKLNG